MRQYTTEIDDIVKHMKTQAPRTTSTYMANSNLLIQIHPKYMKPIVVLTCLVAFHHLHYAVSHCTKFHLHMTITRPQESHVTTN